MLNFLFKAATVKYVEGNNLLARVSKSHFFYVGTNLHVCLIYTQRQRTDCLIALAFLSKPGRSNTGIRLTSRGSQTETHPFTVDSLINKRVTL